MFSNFEFGDWVLLILFVFVSLLIMGFFLRMTFKVGQQMLLQKEQLKLLLKMTEKIVGEDQETRELKEYLKESDEGGGFFDIPDNR